MVRLLYFLLVLALVPAGAQVPRCIIDEEQLREWLKLPSADVEVQAPEMPCAGQRPRLELRRVEADGSNVQVRMSCSRVSECLPFYVRLKFSNGAQARVFIAAHGTVTRDEIRDLGVVHAGATVELGMKSGPVHMRFRVRCLQTGRVGDWIRVSDPQTRRLYRARVVSSETVEGEL